MLTDSQHLHSVCICLTLFVFLGNKIWLTSEKRTRRSLFLVGAHEYFSPLAAALQVSRSPSSPLMAHNRRRMKGREKKKMHLRLLEAKKLSEVS